MIRKITAFAMALLLLAGLLPICARGSGLSKSERYEAAVDELKRYFDGEASMELTDLFEAFESLGWYSYSAQLAMYTAVFRDAEKQEYGDVFLYIEMMRVDSRFNEYLMENEFPTLDEVESYARATQAEVMGDAAAAVAYYAQCPMVLDSMMRYQLLKYQQVQQQYKQALACLAEDTLDGYEQAAALLEELAESEYRDSRKRLEEAHRLAEERRAAQPEDKRHEATAAPVTTPAPEENVIPLIATVVDGVVRLNWIKPEGAASFEIYRRTNASAWKKIATTKNDYYFDNGVGSYTTYKYYVKAVQGGEQSAEAEVRTEFIAPEAKSTATPTPPPPQGTTVPDKIGDVNIEIGATPTPTCEPNPEPDDEYYGTDNDDEESFLP